MDTNSLDNLEFVRLINVKGNVENITPHKIAVVAFIREYGLLKVEEKDMIDCTMAPKYRKDFCLLALKLIQCPDMEFKNLEALLTDGRYNLLSVHLQNFCVRLQNIYVNGINALMDCVTSAIDKLMIEQSETNPCVITRCSVLGFYLRRIMLQLDKLTFVQVVTLYKSFCSYYQRGRPGLMMRSLSKEKLNTVDAPAQVSACISVENPEEFKPADLCYRMNVLDRDSSFEECQWSRKQAELFTAQQAHLLQLNEDKAMPARQLQKTITQIINDVPNYPDVHFLSFLNCMRAKEFCGAQDSLYNCFDRTVFSVANSAVGSGDKNKHFRYAALNRAAMHTQFGHMTVAMEGVREALASALEAGDAACAAAAAAWGARAGGRAARAAARGGARAARAAAAAAAHLAAQHAAVSGAAPSHVFKILKKGDSVNYLHSMSDLTVAGLANMVALWSLYGKTEMASVAAQLLLNLNTKRGVGGTAIWQGGVAGAGGAGGALCVAAWRGDPAAAAIASNFAPPNKLLTRHAAVSALHQGKWEEADQHVQQLASYDRWESQLLKAEMFYLKGDPVDALASLEDIIEYCNTEDDSLHYISLRLKAMILMSQVQHTFSDIQSTNVMILNDALSIAKNYHMHYLAAVIEANIANVQLHMGCAKNALVLVRKVLPSIMEHGSAYDCARALLLYTKCRIACAPSTGETRIQVLQSCCDALETVKKNFAKVGAQTRLLHTWYLQAQLYNELGNHAARNHCAWTYRQIESQNPLENANMLLVMY